MESSERGMVDSKVRIVSRLVVEAQALVEKHKEVLNSLLPSGFMDTIQNALGSAQTKCYDWISESSRYKDVEEADAVFDSVKASLNAVLLAVGAAIYQPYGSTDEKIKRVLDLVLPYIKSLLQFAVNALLSRLGNG